MISYEIIQSLTFITMHISPSRFARETHSTLYVTRAVFTIIGTGCVAVAAVESRMFTSCKQTRYNTVNADTFNNIV